MTPQTATPPQSEAADTGQSTGIVDCDVHNGLPSRDALKPYLAKRWQADYDSPWTLGSFAGAVSGARYGSVVRRDANPEAGPAGSDLGLLREQLLDTYGITKAILHPVLDTVLQPQHGEFAAACAKGMNEWMATEWLARDDRLYGSITVPIEDAERAAEEIARTAVNRRFVKVTITIMTREGLGHQKYWPLYEAAVAHQLPVTAHVGGFSGTHGATGWPTYFVESHTQYPQIYQAQVVSLVAGGVFDRFPQLQIVLEEGGISWLLPLMWRLDRNWTELRKHVPHMERRPSEVIREHFYLTTQPLDDPERPGYLARLLDELAMDDRILFASDYPHWDFDDVNRVLPATVIGTGRRERILAANADALFRFGGGQ
jgi:uncharacterized protein